MYLAKDNNTFYLTETFGTFAIDPVTGLITTTSNISYEAAQIYTLSIRAFDSNGGSDARSSTAVVTVIVSKLYF